VTEVVSVTAPTPLSIVIDVALDTFHDNVPDCPEMIDEGLAVNEAITGTGSACVVAWTPADGADELPVGS
jgi:hypothetical protein